jgi:hypothetical protein
VEVADVAAADGEAVAGELGFEGLVVWVDEDFDLLVVQPLPD